MSKLQIETPSRRAVRRIQAWVRTQKTGDLLKRPALTQSHLLVILAIAGCIDNRQPRGPLTGRSGIGPTVVTLATLARVTDRWAREVVRWLSQPLADLEGQPLDLRGAAAPGPGGRRTHHGDDDYVEHVPFIRRTGGGAGGGRRNRIWLHPAFFDMPEEEFKMLSELPDWPQPPDLNRNSVPIQSGTDERSEQELSSAKPIEENTAAARARLEELQALEAQGSFAAPVALLPPCGGAGVLPPAPVSPPNGDSGRCSKICAGSDLAVLVGALVQHGGVERFDLVAPDRVHVEGHDKTKNKNWRWTRRDAEGGRRCNVWDGLFEVAASDVVDEIERSAPATLRDGRDPHGNPTLGRDIYWRASRSGAWSVIVLDDVVIARLPACKRVITQTSSASSQAYLFVDALLDEGDRFFAQAHFVSQGICDKGAKSGDRWTRPPGSVNRKLGRDSFVTRIVEMHLDDPVLMLNWDDLRAQREKVPVPVPVDHLEIERERREGAGGGSHAGVVTRSRYLSRPRTDLTRSGDDMSNAMSMIRRGATDAAVRSYLVGSAQDRGKPDPGRYADLTLSRARLAIATGGQLPSPLRLSTRTRSS